MIRAMKETGKQWLSEIPEHWRVLPLGRVFEERREATTSIDAIPLSVTKRGVVDQLDDVAVSVDGAPKKLVRKGDLVINSRSDRKGASGLSPRDGSVSVINTVLRPVGIDPRYAHHLIRSTAFQEEFYRFGTGIVADLWTTRWTSMKSIAMPVPPLDEQRAIADYLDRETSEIEAFVAAQGDLLALIDEQRVAMLGGAIRYPSDFYEAAAPKFTRIKYAGAVTLGKMLDQSEPGHDSMTANYLRAANVQPWGRLALDGLKRMTFSTSELRRLDLKQGDVLVVEGGVGGFGRAAYLSHDLPLTGFQNSIVRIRPNEGWEGRFVSYCLILLRHRGYIETVSSVASMPHFTAEKVADTPLPVLPYEVQVSIADRLDEFMEVSNSNIFDAEQSIALTKERQAALVSAAVTGKIDVVGQRTTAEEQQQKMSEVHV